MSRSGYQGVPNTPRLPTPPPLIASIPQSQPTLGYGELDKYERN